MNKLATELALDPAALSDEVHETQKENSDGKGKERGEVGVHSFSSIEPWGNWT
jgi:hypothetical protein